MRPLCLAAWVAAASNMIPFFDLNALAVQGRFKAIDGLMVILVAATVLTGALGKRPRSAIVRRLFVALCFLGAWWAFTLLRTLLVEGVQFLPAALFGRDLLYASITTVCFVGLLGDVRVAVKMLRLLVVAVSVYAIAYLGTALLHVDSSWIVHSSMVRDMGGIQREWTLGNQLAVAMVPVCIWWALVAPRRRVALTAAVAIILSAQVFVQMTRANYVAVAAGMLASIAMVLCMRGYAPLRRKVGRRFAVGAGIMAAAVLVVLLAAQFVPLQPRGEVSYVQARVGSLAGVLAGDTANANSWSLRLGWAATTIRLIGSDWPWGLGFLHPSVKYRPELPGGTIRNTHLGYIDALAPFGLIGLAFILLPCLVVLAPAFRRRYVKVLDSDGQALVAAVTAFILGALVSSIIQTNLWTLPVSGMILAIGVLCFSDASPLAAER